MPRPRRNRDHNPVLTLSDSYSSSSSAPPPSSSPVNLVFCQLCCASQNVIELFYLFKIFRFSWIVFVLDHSKHHQAIRYIAASCVLSNYTVRQM